MYIYIYQTFRWLLKPPPSLDHSEHSDAKALTSQISDHCSEHSDHSDAKALRSQNTKLYVLLKTFGLKICHTKRKTTSKTDTSYVCYICDMLYIYMLFIYVIHYIQMLCMLYMLYAIYMLFICSPFWLRVFYLTEFVSS